MFINRNAETQKLRSSRFWSFCSWRCLTMFAWICMTWYDHDMKFAFSRHEESSTFLVEWLGLLAPSSWDRVRVALRILKSLKPTIFHWSSLAPSPCGSAGTGFNPGSTLGMHDSATGAMAAQVAMNTTLSAATGGITVFIFRYFITKKYDVGGLCNGILAGLVSITAGCGNMECGSAFATGLVGGIVYQARFCSWILKC